MENEVLTNEISTEVDEYEEKGGRSIARFGFGLGLVTLAGIGAYKLVKTVKNKVKSKKNDGVVTLKTDDSEIEISEKDYVEKDVDEK